MDNNPFTNTFASRLRQSLIDNRQKSNRSTSGADVQLLAEITGHSTQICRKYLRGEATPKPTTLIKIAEKLAVKPGWLLFGEDHMASAWPTETITINKGVLHYIFTQANGLFIKNKPNQDIADFLLHLTTNICQINVEDQDLKKIIDLAMLSTKHA